MGLLNVSTGCTKFDALLGGGLVGGRVYLVYGQAEIGKTTFAIQCAVNSARTGKKVIFVDSDSTFSVRRMSQIAKKNCVEVSPHIILMRPKDFAEQAVVVNQIDQYLTGQTGLVVVDTCTSLYRAELEDNLEKIVMLNRELNRQIACLIQATKTRGIPVLLTSQVHDVLLGDTGITEPVAMRVLKFWSDIVVRLKPTAKKNILEAVLEKRRNRKRMGRHYLIHDQNGLHDSA